MIMRRTKESAVSPVIGILLMIVVTVIIAAVVSGFAGSMVTSQQKAPQAQISGVFSIADGFSIKHQGGDPLATKDIQIVVKNSKLWGPDVEQKSAQLINKMNISTSSTADPGHPEDDTAKFWEDANGSVTISSFNAGDTYYISAWNCTGNILQPNVAPHGWNPTYPDYVMSKPGNKASYWALMFRNPDNIGKSFIMEVSDKSSGKLISKSDVPITS